MQNVTVLGKGGIKATIIQHSITEAGKHIITFELDYPRFIHSELMTHRMFSRNAASSRAIPVEKMHQHIIDTPATPIHWGKNQQGMQAKAEVNNIEQAQTEWRIAAQQAILSSKDLLDAGLHKQIANRVTEAFQMMKTIVTSTEWDNWYELRNHVDAQPEIHELAWCMLQAQTASKPFLVKHNEWHVPYISRVRDYLNGPVVYRDSTGCALAAESALMISASCCAQVSYRKSDDTFEKAKAIFDRLINSKPQHASPIEHQATPMHLDRMIFPVPSQHWEKGITHVSRDGHYGSGNFIGWLQYRQLL
jgi:thymidylate synthase ThyX